MGILWFSQWVNGWDNNDDDDEDDDDNNNNNNNAFIFHTVDKLQLLYQAVM